MRRVNCFFLVQLLVIIMLFLPRIASSYQKEDFDFLRRNNTNDILFNSGDELAKSYSFFFIYHSEV